MQTMANKAWGIFLLLGVTVSLSHGLLKTEQELNMREVEEEVAKNSILLYDKDEVQNITSLEQEVKEMCQCKVDHLPAIEGFILHYPDGNHLPATKFLSIKGIVLADEDHVVAPPDDEIDEEERMIPLDERQNGAPNDQYYSAQWALGNNAGDINWPEGSQKYLSDSQGGSSNGPKVVVAVIDSGVDYNHPDLRDAMWRNPQEIAGNGIDDDGNGIVDDIYGANFVQSAGNSKNDPMDKDVGTRGYGHGTHCAGIIAATANNRQGIAGVAGISKGKVKIMALRALGPRGGATSWLMAALDYAIAKGAKISSNSYGGSDSQGQQENAAWKRVLERNPGHLFISAAGNEETKIGANYSPAANTASNHICVASSTESSAMSDFSNYGTPYVHVFAPGSRIASTFPNNRYKYSSGTSMACPMVSGLAALLMSMRANLKGARVKQLIEQNVQTKSQFRGRVTTGGLIDVDKTIKALADGDNGGDDGNDGGDPSCTDQPGREAWCQRYTWACNRYEWFKEICKKTCNACDGDTCSCNHCEAGCNCSKPCNNRYSDSYCCQYREFCERLPATHWFVRGCAGTCNKC